jgi:DNA-binding GntR family transcriptional regulator
VGGARLKARVLIKIALLCKAAVLMTMHPNKRRSAVDNDRRGAIKSVRAATATIDVGQRIRDDIVTGVLGFGERVTIDALASRYDVSHMPVREALRELQGEGLVVSEPNRGARVRTIDANFVDHLFEIRIALEVMLIRRAAQRTRTSDIEALRSIEDDLERDIRAGHYPGVVAHNRAFHQAINRIADNVDALPIIDKHWTLLAALWRHYGYGESRFAGVANDHRHLISALEVHDADAAALMMGAHSNKAKLVLQARMAVQHAASVTPTKRTKHA